MKISKKTQYALRALIEFTHHHGRPPLLRRDIAQKQHIPLQFLEHILLTLKHAGLLASHRGVRGGYSLIKQPRQITLGQVIRIMDGSLLDADNLKLIAELAATEDYQVWMARVDDSGAGSVVIEDGMVQEQEDSS